MATPTKNIPVLPLPTSFYLLPGARISIPIGRKLAQELSRFLSDDDQSPFLVAAVPVVGSTEQESGHLFNWGCSARVVRVSRPPALLASQPHILSLQGIQRIKVEDPIPSLTTLQPLAPITISFPPSLPQPSQQSVEAFRRSALALLDRVSKDSIGQKGSGPLGSSVVKYQPDAFTKLRDLVQDAPDDKLPMVADLLVAVLRTLDESDWLKFLSTTDLTARLQLASELFAKQVVLAEISTDVQKSVAESVTRQQKEYILQQQMAAIQRELSRLRRGGSTNPNSPPLSRTNSMKAGETFDQLDDEFDAPDDEEMEYTELKGKIQTGMAVGSEERKLAVREFKRLKKIPNSSVEHGVVRHYLEWLTSLPWPGGAANPTSTVMEKEFLTRARQQLDKDHYGLEKIKKRLIEYLAILRLKQLAASRESQEAVSLADSQALVLSSSPDAAQNPTPASTKVLPKAVTSKAPILLLHGPPGTGKTSIAQSLAKALDRPFQRISLGGVRDEAEIRGHRRTYVASGPGAIVQALRKAGRLDAVILLDEIDKVSSANHNGDPSAALLEVLDPEQNSTFKDHYINTPIDLSQVIFIATANSLDTISRPLFDRCEVIDLAGYTYDEKMSIARKFLLPKQIRENGFESSKLEITDAALKHIIEGYTREAGVRGLERQVGGLVRFKAVEWSELAERGQDSRYSSIVDKADLERILGMERFDFEERNKDARRGVVYGLVVMGAGEGGILPVETAALPGAPGGHMKLTGSLGDVIRESAEISLAWVRSHAYALGITPSPSHDVLQHPDAIDIHLHLPSGAQKKDGPSAGIAMTCAFVSLLSGATVPNDIAMTGEITLRGNVTAVGGIKEKVLGAHRAGIKKVIIPRRNQKDVEEDVPKEIKDQMQFVFVSTIKEALVAAFDSGEAGVQLGWREGRRGFVVESRL